MLISCREVLEKKVFATNNHHDNGFLSKQFRRSALMRSINQFQWRRTEKEKQREKEREKVQKREEKEKRETKQVTEER